MCLKCLLVYRIVSKKWKRLNRLSQFFVVIQSTRLATLNGYFTWLSQICSKIYIRICIAGGLDAENYRCDRTTTPFPFGF
jgi:hypothetical protein